MNSFYSGSTGNKDYWIDMSNLFGDETLFFSFRLDADNFSVARFDFSPEYDSYEVSRTWQNLEGGCDPYSPPSMWVDI